MGRLGVRSLCTPRSVSRVCRFNLVHSMEGAGWGDLGRHLESAAWQEEGSERRTRWERLGCSGECLCHWQKGGAGVPPPGQRWMCPRLTGDVEEEPVQCLALAAQPLAILAAVCVWRAACSQRKCLRDVGLRQEQAALEKAFLGREWPAWPTVTGDPQALSSTRQPPS